MTDLLVYCSWDIVVEKDWRFLVREISVARVSENWVMDSSERYSVKML